MSWGVIHWIFCLPTFVHIEATMEKCNTNHSFCEPSEGIINFFTCFHSGIIDFWMLSFELTSFTLSLLYSSRIILFICPKITRFNWQSGSDLLVSPCAWKETSNSVYSFSINVSLVLTECYYIIDFIHPRSYINLSWNLHFFNNQHKSRPFVRLSV